MRKLLLTCAIMLASLCPVTRAAWIASAFAAAANLEEAALRLTVQRVGWPMIAIVYFSEMLVASLLAIVLLAISRPPISSDAVLFAGGVAAWTLAEYIVHRFVLHGFAPTEHRLHHANPDDAVLRIFFGRYGFVSRWSF